MKATLVDKKIVGHGGLHCPCCNKMGGVKNARVALNRRERRKNKIQIKNEKEI